MHELSGLFSMNKYNSLRAVTSRLNNTPVKELPHIAYFLASSIQNCADALKSTSGPSAGKNDDLSLQVHKLKAKISSLLQDRSAEGRFTAIVLVKATVEAGGREILGSCEPWLRALLAILNKTDPVSSRRLCLLTITRIFSLTQHYPTLIREITTPLLPAFVTACMKLGALHPSPEVEVQATRPSPHLETVLHCMLHLIPDHPSTFRPFASKLHTKLVNFIGGHPRSNHITHLAQSVFVTLHFCAPKNTAGDQWHNACQAVIASIHRIADQILRVIIEDWETSDGGRRQTSLQKAFDEVPHSIDGDPLGLAPWEGVYKGSRVLVSLLHLLKKFLLEQTSRVVDLPLGLILDLTSRLLYIRVPASSKEAQMSVRFNPEVGREEREELLAILPEIHQSTLNLLSSLVEATGLSMLPASPTIIDQCLWVFGSEHSIAGIRLASYRLLDNLMPLMGPSTTKDSFKPLLGLIDCCCNDVGPKNLESEAMVQSKAGLITKPVVNGHADSFLQMSSKKITRSAPEVSALEIAASTLLCHMLEYTPAQAIPHSLRAQIDRTAILQDQKRVMLASVLNPAPKTTGKYATPSIMPFLARMSQGYLEVEGLLRPRLPVIRDVKTSPYDREVGSDQDLEIEHFNHAESTDGRSTGPPTEPTVGTAGTQNDILDRLEDSIEDGAVSASKVDTPKANTANQALVEPFSQRNDNTPQENSFSQGVKRNFSTIDVREEEESSKRFRNSELDLAPDLVAPLEETTASTSTVATTTAIVDPDPVVPIEPGLGATVIDKGKGRATSTSPRPEGLDAFGEANADDDESDSDIPPLYLKTSSEEEDEDEEIV